MRIFYTCVCNLLDPKLNTAWLSNLFYVWGMNTKTTTRVVNPCMIEETKHTLRKQSRRKNACWASIGVWWYTGMPALLATRFWACWSARNAGYQIVIFCGVPALLATNSINVYIYIDTWIYVYICVHIYIFIVGLPALLVASLFFLVCQHRWLPIRLVFIYIYIYVYVYIQMYKQKY